MVQGGVSEGGHTVRRVCRTSAQGGRRCPACSSAEGRDAHNARRRHNRALQRAIAEWARAAGEPGEVVDMLAAGPAAAAKQWAAGRGLDEEAVRH